ncbi:hypothetical protein FNO01nite_01480 [Flavobacterium noncentrifugens]|uniref:helix-turn-helix domain-containing protein n=1 Tax=Flavobacterium noncentrifugens TaxID=1128970 RepID=UPI000A98B74D|nr:AraC family transcriptional regulator [Flavobacterium noncentrifugens]GEP49476.1 hypothetical protein FNO01nite_01480 [Flavobacterium noncentrifugens]
MPKPQEAFVLLPKDKKIREFIQSLVPFYLGEGKIDEAVSDVKRVELLKILLDANPPLAAVLFDFGKPEKIDLQSFMNRNFKFNVSLKRFAFLTGRSLSAFKRDFVGIFNDTPNRWLVKKRLEEAHFRISKKHQKATDIYLDLGFEDLSHFSFAFRKKFGFNPTDLGKNTTTV